MKRDLYAEIGAHIRGFMWIAARRTAIGARGGLIYGNDYTSVRDKFAVVTMTDRLSTFIDFYTRYVSHRGAREVCRVRLFAQTRNGSSVRLSTPR